MGYNTNIQVYYHKQNEAPIGDHRLAPAPQINITPEFYYANDSIIGYTYTITLNGYANSLRKDLNNEATDSLFSETIDHIGKIREIFNTNGGNLTVKYQNGNNVLVAKGATIKSVSFNESDNKWVNYAPYTIELEFNEVDFIGCDGASPINCSQTIFHTPVQDSNNIVSDALVDMKEYKIKEFKDKWTFTIENDIYQYFGSENNSAMKVSYTLSATGKNYYQGDNTTIPAWQQAKRFVQDRLYRQVLGLINSPVTITNNNISACSATLTPSQIHDNAMGSDLNSLDSFNVFNETISCDTSESDGSFSVTYNAILKYGSQPAMHTFTHNLQTTNDDKYETTATIQGTVKGLITGGFIRNINAGYSLPQNGQFIIASNAGETRYQNALSYLHSNVGDELDLLSGFKSLVGIDTTTLGVKNAVIPKPINYSLEHNYIEGTIGYTASYSSEYERNRLNGFTNISITHKAATEIFQEFIIPGRASGPLIQKLNMYNPRTVSINIDGSNPQNRGCSVYDICNSLPSIPNSLLPLLNQESDSWIKTKDSRTKNTIDGSYSISLEYTCKGRT